MLKSKRILLTPIIFVTLSVIILYPFFYKNIFNLFIIIKIIITNYKFPIKLNLEHLSRTLARLNFNLTTFKFLLFFFELFMMSFTDMLFERVSQFIPFFLMITGIIFVFIIKQPIIPIIESISVGLVILALLDIFRIGSYAFGDILAAGAIGAYVGYIDVIIIVLISIILGKIIFFINIKLDNFLHKNRDVSLHMAFVPILFFSSTVICKIFKLY
jgi:hypothetical protein